MDDKLRKKLKSIKTRKMLPSLLKSNNFKRICEVGVKQGFNLKRLSKSSPDLLVGIDIWDEILWYENLKRWANQQSFQVKLIRDYSLNAVSTFDNEYFDFVYIDASHIYEDVKKDIEKWWIKVKKGGVLGGHDYTIKKKIKKKQTIKFGVYKAVNEFVENNDLWNNFFETKADISNSFFIIKET